MAATGQKSTFLFWNLNGRDLARPVAALAQESDAEVVILAEASGFDMRGFIQMSNELASPPYFEASRSGGQLRILTRFQTSFLERGRTSTGSRWSMNRLRIPGHPELLLVCVHLRSKLYADEKEQYGLARRLSHEVLKVEAKLPHRRTLLIGDFNMNPDEDGMLGCDALHGCMSRREMQNCQSQRRWDNADYPMFFNPMWSHLGDRSGRAPGTCFYPESTAVARYWHMFDQVLLRADLLPSLDDDDIQIVAQIGADSLLNRLGRPDKSMYSDHLPLLVRLAF